jgi:hypothetical protein
MRGHSKINRVIAIRYDQLRENFLGMPFIALSSLLDAFCLSGLAQTRKGASRLSPYAGRL